MAAVGEESRGDFLLHFLEKEGSTKTHLAKTTVQRGHLAIEPPDKFHWCTTETIVLTLN